MTYPDWSHLNYTGERRIAVEACSGSTSRVLASVRPVEEGDWGPVSLPWLEGVRYTLRLEGSPIIPLEESFAAPVPGAHLRFDLQAELGHDLWFIALDESREIIKNAEAAVFWEENGNPRVLRRRARPDGYINPWSVPSGIVKVCVSAPGYVPAWGDPIEVPEKEPRAWELVLKKGATLLGRCEHQGVPVEDFEVVLWQEGKAEYTQVARSFHGRVDGSFEMNGVPAGDYLVTASSGELPGSEPQVLQIPSEDPVVLELPTPIRGRGTVVDLRSAEPVAGAEVQLFVSGAEGPVRPWGPPHPVDPEGAFEILGFTPGNNTIRVRARDHAERFVSAVARIGEDLHLGQITLAKPQVLEVHLLSDGPLDFTVFEAHSIVRTKLPRRHFDSSGLVRYEGVNPGGFILQILRPDGPWVNLVLDLEPGEEWRFAHKVSGSRKVTIEIVPEEGKTLAGYRGMLLAYVSSSGVTTEWGISIPPDGIRTVEGIDANSVEVSVLDAQLVTTASAQASFEGKEELYLRVELGGEPFSVHVVDEEGVGIPGVSVQMTDPTTPFYRHGTTGADGVCELRGVPQREVLLHLDSPRGRRYGIGVDGGAGSCEVILSSKARIELLLRDGDQPISLVTARFSDTTEQYRFSVLGTSDERGRILGSGLSEGHYHILADHPDCWPVTIDVEASPDASPVDVQIRRLGGVHFEVRTARGLPVAGQEITLTSTEFKTDVGTWIEEERVSAEQGLVSGLDGEIRIERLPHGSYRWALSTPEGELLEGTVEVPAGDVLRFPLVLP